MEHPLLPYNDLSIIDSLEMVKNPPAFFCLHVYLHGLDYFAALKMSTRTSVKNFHSDKNSAFKSGTSNGKIIYKATAFLTSSILTLKGGGGGGGGLNLVMAILHLCSAKTVKVKLKLCDF